THTHNRTHSQMHTHSTEKPLQNHTTTQMEKNKYCAYKHTHIHTHTHTISHTHTPEHTHRCTHTALKNHCKTTQPLRWKKTNTVHINTHIYTHKHTQRDKIGRAHV